MKILPLLFTLSLSAQADLWTDTFSREQVPTPIGVDPQIGGLDTFPDQRIAAAFHRGQVMIYNPVTKDWKLFAEGLHEPLGLLIEDDKNILVMQRPELTRLTDTDGDGVADEYTTVYDEFGMSGNYHEFAFGPAKDKDGNLFISLGVASNGAGIREEIRGEFQPIGIPRERMLSGSNWGKNKNAAGRMYSRVPYRGWIMKIAPDGTATPYASGVRSPNGIGFDADGRLFVMDNQGDWLGTSKIHHIREGAFHGHPAALVWREGWSEDPLKTDVKKLNAMRTRAAGLMPQGELANSPTQPIVVPGDIFKGISGQTLIGEMNQPTLVRFLPDPGVTGASQGATIPFLQSNAFGNGRNRMTFTRDGSLWIGKTHLSWPGAEGLIRIRQKNPEETLFVVESVKLQENGFLVTFTKPVAKDLPKEFSMKRYTYNYHQAYGSKKEDEATVDLKIRRLNADGRTFYLECDKAQLKEDYLYSIDLRSLTSIDNKPVLGDKIYYHLISTKK